jgi:hypothetical protein
MSTQTTGLHPIIQKLRNAGLIAEICPGFINVRLRTREVYPNEVLSPYFILDPVKFSKRERVLYLERCKFKSSPKRNQA